MCSLNCTIYHQSMKIYIWEKKIILTCTEWFVAKFFATTRLPRTSRKFLAGEDKMVNSIYKVCIRTCIQNRNSERFLQCIFAGYKNKLSEHERLVNLSWSQRCWFAYSNASKSSQVPSISCSRESLSTQSNVFRSNSSFKSIYKNKINRSCLSSSTKYQASGLKRLVNSQFLSRNASFGLRESA